MISRKDIDLYLVDITVHLDILGYSIVLPIMASLNESLGGDVDDLSLLFSSYAVTQFISMVGFNLPCRLFIHGTIERSYWSQAIDYIISVGFFIGFGYRLIVTVRGNCARFISIYYCINHFQIDYGSVCRKLDCCSSVG